MMIYSRSRASTYDIMKYMKFITPIMLVLLFVVIYTSATISDKFVYIGHGFSQEKVTEMRQKVFSGIKKSNHNH